MWNLPEVFPTELHKFPLVHLCFPADLLLVLLKPCNIFPCHKFPRSEVVSQYISVSCKAFVGVFFLFLASAYVCLSVLISFPLVSVKFCFENLDKYVLDGKKDWADPKGKKNSFEHWSNLIC